MRRRIKSNGDSNMKQVTIYVLAQVEKDNNIADVMQDNYILTLLVIIPPYDVEIYYL